MQEIVASGRVKFCPDCKKDKSVSAFSLLKTGEFSCYCKKCKNRQNRERYQQNGKSQSQQERARIQNWQRKYGLTQEHYDTMLEAQGGVCAACGHPEYETDPRTGKTRWLVVDHCHKTGRVRALLCSPCNRALGYFYEDASRIEGLWQYALRIKDVGA